MFIKTSKGTPKIRKSSGNPYSILKFENNKWKTVESGLSWKDLQEKYGMEIIVRSLAEKYRNKNKDRNSKNVEFVNDQRETDFIDTWLVEGGREGAKH